MEKTKQQLIEDYKKANKERREKIAQKNGFKTGEEYLASLTKQEVKKVTKKTTSKMKGIFYVVDILDASGSMDGGKYENSKKGIIDGIKDLAPRKDVKYSLFEFIQESRSLNHPLDNVSPSDVNVDNIRFSGAIGGDTPLYYAVYTVIKRMNVTKDDKVLINVYTDGGNNSKSEYVSMAAKLIKEVQKENFTVTFVATTYDLERIKRDINIDDSNTLVTANTAEGFKMSMGQTRSARTAYFAGASAGQNVLKGFYKRQGKL